MAKIKFFSFLLLILLFSFNCQSKRLSQSQEKKNNIIFILADDLGYGELGCYGQEKIKTPHIDSIAEEGIKFTQFYSGQTVCAPSRCSFLTGLHQGHAQIRDNSGGFLKKHISLLVKDDFPSQWPLLPNTTTIGTLLQKQGYTTACVGKWGLGHPQNSGAPNKQGFDFFYGYICQVQAHNYYPRYLWRNDKKETLEGNDRKLTGKHYAADLMETECLNFIKKNKDNPFFLYFATPVPHVALQVPEDSLKEYSEKWKEKPYTGNSYLPHTNPRAAYAGMVTRMDRSVGRIMSLLKELQLEDNTLIIFTSDNGATFNGGYDREFFRGNGQLKGFKTNMYEGGIRVPLVAKWPGKIKAGSVSHHISAIWDMLPTFTEISRASTPQDIDGISILPTLLGREQKKHKLLYWEFPSKKFNGQVLRKDNWKILRSAKNNIELFDLETDPSESKNLSKQHPDIVKEMLILMKQEHTTNPYFPMSSLNEKLTGIENIQKIYAP